MPLETATFINELNADWPLGDDPIREADDHMRLIKSTIQTTFPNITGEVTASQAELNLLVGETSFPGVAGIDEQVQFNSGGNFAASSNLTFDGSRLTAAALLVTGLTTIGLADSSAEGIARDGDDGSIYISGGPSQSVGAHLTMFGESNATVPGNIAFTVGTDDDLWLWDNATGQHRFSVGSGASKNLAMLLTPTEFIFGSDLIEIRSSEAGDPAAGGTITATIVFESSNPLGFGEIGYRASSDVLDINSYVYDGDVNLYATDGTSLLTEYGITLNSQALAINLDVNLVPETLMDFDSSGATVVTDAAIQMFTYIKEYPDAGGATDGYALVWNDANGRLELTAQSVGGQVDSVTGGTNINVTGTAVDPVVNLDAAITGVSVNGVTLSNAGAATSYLDETGNYSVPAGGGGGTPGGVDTEIQYNNAGAFGGFGGWDGTKFSLDTTEKFNINSQAADTVNLTADSGSLQIGNVAGLHIGIDRNTIQAKSNGTTAGTLNINNVGGDVNFGNGIALTGMFINTPSLSVGGWNFDSTQDPGASEDNWVMTYDFSTDRIRLAAPTGGGGSPGGSDTQVQYNNGGVFGGIAEMTYNDGSGDITFTSEIIEFSNTLGAIILKDSNTATTGVGNRILMRDSANFNVGNIGYIDGDDSLQIQNAIGEIKLEINNTEVLTIDSGEAFITGTLDVSSSITLGDNNFRLDCEGNYLDARSPSASNTGIDFRTSDNALRMNLDIDTSNVATLSNGSNPFQLEVASGGGSDTAGLQLVTSSGLNFILQQATPSDFIQNRYGSDTLAHTFNDDGRTMDFIFSGDTIDNLMVIDGASNSVGIGLTTSNPNADAILELLSTTKGLLLPRLTTTNRNAMTDVQGMIVYDTDLDAIYKNDGAAWTEVGGGGGGGIGGSITDNQIAVGATTANDIEGTADFTYTDSLRRLEVGTGLDNQSGEIYIGRPSGQTRGLEINHSGASGGADIINFVGNIDYDARSASAFHNFIINSSTIFRIDDALVTSFTDFEVDGILKIDAPSGFAILEMESALSNDVQLKFSNATNGEIARLQVTDAGEWVFLEDNGVSEALRIYPDGDLDIDGFITQYNGTASITDGHVLTWNTSNNRAEFAAAGGGGGNQFTVVNVTTTSQTITSFDAAMVDDDTAGSTVTITLPAGATDSQVLVKKLGTTANVIIDGDSAETIDGNATFTLTAQYASATLLWNGTEWSII